MASQYVTTAPVDSALVAAIENLIPRHCRSVKCLHGDTDADPVRYEAHRSEIKYVRRAIATARLASAIAKREHEALKR